TSPAWRCMRSSALNSFMCAAPNADSARKVSSQTVFIGVAPSVGLRGWSEWWLGGAIRAPRRWRAPTSSESPPTCSARLGWASDMKALYGSRRCARMRGNEAGSLIRLRFRFGVVSLNLRFESLVDARPKAIGGAVGAVDDEFAR